ncbi:HNH endonuclease [Paenarthrobacter sp. Z7-10]|nr:HNH endonuclease [Paenarthrobacter sp. Z7-10]
MLILVLALVAAVLGWLHTNLAMDPAGPGHGFSPPVVETNRPGAVGPVLRVHAAPALSVVEILTVRVADARNNYDRQAFGEPWLDVDRNSCDTRDDVLRRDLTDVQLVKGSRCLVAAGRLSEPYTGRVMDFSRGPDSSKAIQIDHVVALGDAWRSGAQQLTALQRQNLANDPLNLIAVDGPTNVDKSDGDTAAWLPPNKAFRCQYVARQVSVKAAYRLWITPAEKEAMKRVLDRCPGQQTLESGYPP